MVMGPAEPETKDDCAGKASSNSPDQTKPNQTKPRQSLLMSQSKLSDRKIWSWLPTGPHTKIDHASEGHLQSIRPDQDTQLGVDGWESALELAASHEPFSTEAEESALLEAPTK
jgi:hypothetical protein